MTLPMLEGGETDAERIVGVDQIFFSLTDMKGLITGSNRTFSAISKYPADELLRSPHSIVRHPDMPAGVFQIMWDRLEANLPVAAYVKNRAKDGRLYWVFATVTPIAGGYLSVRTRPVFKPYWDAADGLYVAARPHELAASADGARRPEAAAVGVGLLDQGLRDAGFSGFEEFMMEALPEEVALRQSLSQRPAVNAQPGSPLGAVVGGAQVLDQETDILLAQIGRLGGLATAMTEALGRNEQVRDLLWSAAEEASVAVSVEGTFPPALVRGAEGIREWVRRACEPLGKLGDQLTPLKDAARAARFGIALARLHNEMVLSFAYEVNLGDTPHQSIEFVPLLCQTIMEDVERLSVDLEQLRASLDESATRIAEALEALQKTREYIASWQLLVGRYGITELDEVVIQIADRQSGVHDHVIELIELAQECLDIVEQIDPFAMLEPLPVIKAGAEEIVTGYSMPVEPVEEAVVEIASAEPVVADEPAPALEPVAVAASVPAATPELVSPFPTRRSLRR